MNKKLLFAIALVVIAGGAAALLTHKSSNNTTMNNMNMSTSKSSSSSQSTQVATTSVAIQDFSFSPPNITVKQGTTVTWTNKDSVTHTVTADGSTGPNSGNLASNKSYSYTFNTAGTFTYHCSIHPAMIGTVTVTQ